MKNHVFFRDFLVNNFDFETLRGRKMILVSKYCWECVQEHRIILGIQYHDLRTSIEEYIAGECKKSVKKDPNPHFFDLFGGGLLAFVYSG